MVSMVVEASKDVVVVVVVMNRGGGCSDVCIYSSRCYNQCECQSTVLAHSTDLNAKAQ